MTSPTTDRTRGAYRYVFQCWLRGRRVNAVSVGAELLFLRLNLLADDFGNLAADPDTLRIEAFPRRKGVTCRQIESWIAELAEPVEGLPALVYVYRVGLDTFIHITDFEKYQKGGPNGRKVRRVPGVSGESGGIQGKPDQCVSLNLNLNPNPNPKLKSEAGASDVATTSRKTAVAAERISWTASGGWCGISDADREAWQAAYPACSVNVQLARMAEWCKANPAKARKSNWRKFITNWLSRSQDRGGDTASNRVGTGPAAAAFAELERRNGSHQ